MRTMLIIQPMSVHLQIARAQSQGYTVRYQVFTFNNELYVGGIRIRDVYLHHFDDFIIIEGYKMIGLRHTETKLVYFKSCIRNVFDSILGRNRIAN